MDISERVLQETQEYFVLLGWTKIKYNTHTEKRERCAGVDKTEIWWKMTTDQKTTTNLRP